jgi:hypothetical protein
MMDGKQRWVVSVRVACAAGACSWVMALPACGSDNSGSSPDGGTFPDSSTATDSGSGVESSSPDGGGASEAGSFADSGGGDALADSSAASDATGSSNDGACLAPSADAATYVANPDGDQCINAPQAGCFNKFAGTWSCNVNTAQFTVGRNGYTRLANSAGQQGAGCMDCSGNWTVVADNQSWVNVGTYGIGDGGTTASMDWNYCAGGTLQACMQASTSYPLHATCTLVVSCAGP